MNLSRGKCSELILLAAFCFSLFVFNGVAIAATDQWEGLGPWGGDVECLITAPAATLYAGTNNGGVFKSSDGGLNWSAVNSGSAIRVCMLW